MPSTSSYLPNLHPHAKNSSTSLFLSPHEPEAAHVTHGSGAASACPDLPESLPCRVPHLGQVRLACHGNNMGTPAGQADAPLPPYGSLLQCRGCSRTSWFPTAFCSPLPPTRSNSIAAAATYQEEEEMRRGTTRGAEVTHKHVVEQCCSKCGCPQRDRGASASAMVLLDSFLCSARPLTVATY